MATVFRIVNLCWATVMTALVVMLCLFELPDPPARSVTGVAFWGVYLLLSLGVFFDLRVAWSLCIVHLVSIWLLMGFAVSDWSFGVVTGQAVDLKSPSTIAIVVLNSFFGVLVPASLLIIILLFSREHLRWLFSRHSRPLAHVRREEKAALRRARREARRFRGAV